MSYWFLEQLLKRAAKAMVIGDAVSRASKTIHDESRMRALIVLLNSN